MIIMDVNSIIIGAVAITLVVFIPGYCLTLALFAKKELDFVERSGISFILAKDFYDAADKVVKAAKGVIE